MFATQMPSHLVVNVVMMLSSVLMRWVRLRKAVSQSVHWSPDFVRMHLAFYCWVFAHASLQEWASLLPCPIGRQHTRNSFHWHHHQVHCLSMISCGLQNSLQLMLVVNMAVVNHLYFCLLAALTLNLLLGRLCSLLVTA